MSYVAALDHLHGLTQELSPSAPRRKFEIEHMRILARALGDPQKQFRSVLIAGTNGKGSTAATLANILDASGLRTGLYTSPHLARVTERIRIADPRNAISRGCHPERSAQRVVEGPAFAEIPEDAFARLYFHVDETAQRLVADHELPHHPSFFETLTALAFLYFAETKVDIAVLEVGLGGRLDATNIVEPLLSVITDIALDHQEYLGNTITEIAREKAGILRPNGILVTLPQHPEANQAIGEAAVALNVRGINAADYLPGRDAIPTGRDLAADSNGLAAGLSPRSDTPKEEGALAPGLPLNHYDLFVHGEHIKVRSPLAGEHQRRNIALAIAAAIELRNHLCYKSTAPGADRNEICYENGNLPNLEAIEAGIANTTWPGRLEFLPPDLLLDVAHNPAGAWTLRAAIANLPESRPRTLIFSCLRDKDLTEMARILFPLFDSSGERRRDHIIFVPINNPRAASLDEMLAIANSLDVPALPAQTTTEAINLARSVTPAGGLIIATGSIYLVGAVREAVLGK